MNSIHKILEINEKELQANVSDAASWHAEYSDTPYIYIGNLHEDLKEKDIVIIFSQYGNPTHLNLIKNKETGKSRGFCYLKYEDHRSCALAIDNFNGVKVYERPLKVDHTYYKLVDGQKEDDFLVEYPEPALIEDVSESVLKPKLLEYEPEPEQLDDLSFKTMVDDDDFEDPMAKFATESIKTQSRKRLSRESLDKKEKRHRHLRSKHDKSKESKEHSSRHSKKDRSKVPDQDK